MSGVGSAQLEMIPEMQEAAPAPEGGASLANSPGLALRQQAAERLAAHRQRRGARHAAENAAAGATRRPGKRAGVVAAVAERYAHSPSYRAVLADEARRAMERAEAEAAVAARNAEAVAAAQADLLAELELWNEPQTFSAETATSLPGPVAIEPEPVPPGSAPDVKPAGSGASNPVAELSNAGITVKLYEDLPRTPMNHARLRRSDLPAPSSAGRGPRVTFADGAAEEAALEDEIAFRQAPVFDDFRGTGPVEPIAANLIEFPRQLVAPKKARPRYAEGPLREDGPEAWEPRGSQLRIFEVGAKLAEPEPEPVSAAPEWSSIWLDAHTVTPIEPVAGDDTVLLPSLLPPATAAVHLRLMAASVDAILVGAAVLGFVALAARWADAVPTGSGAAIAVAGIFALLYVLYHVLFFSLAGQTPGMRYARIGLCTFTDENPSRAAMRKRVLAMIVAASPLGLGLLWVWLDDDRLGWHDRMSRMYQRAY